METDPTNPYGDDGLDLLTPEILDPPEPSWGDVVSGIWDRLRNPLPRTT